MEKATDTRERIPNSIKRAVFVVFSLLLQILWIFRAAVSLTRYYGAAQAAMSIFALVVVLRICGENINSAYKISWIILILVFPVFGLCLFLLFGRSGAAYLFKRHSLSAAAELMKNAPKDETVLKRLLQENKGLGNQAYYIQKTAGYPLYANTDVKFYGDTSEALEAQKEALRGAEHFIFMEYHAIEASESWKGLEEILAQKAEAGVEVRIIYDDAGSIGFLSSAFVKHLNSLGIHCRVFNPILPVLNIFMNHRDHRKITVVDGRVGFTGGYNLADEYFNLIHPYGQWKDSGIRLEGDAVDSLTLIFLEQWAATQRKSADPQPYLGHAVTVPQGTSGTVQPYADSPLDGVNVGENVYLNMIKNAKDYLYITTPYLIISDEMHRELVLAAQRGVDIRLVTPGIPDKKLIFRVTRSYYAGLAAQGVRIFEYTPGFLHQKQFVADDEVAVVGTINLDFRSLYLHFENACQFMLCDAVMDVKKDFEEIFAVSREVTGQYSAKRNVSVRGFDCILRLFAPLL